MLSYLSIYLYISFQSLKGKVKISSYSYYLIFAVLTIFIGLRHEIGVDWFQYIDIMQRFENSSLIEVFLNVEPSYMFLSWIGSQLGNNIYIVNFISAIILLSGLLSYSNKQEYPWLALLISFPILIIVVGLGYTRQACAIGIEFFALIAIENNKYYKSILLLFLASTFHISILPLIFLFIKKPKKNIFQPKNIILIFIFMMIGVLIYNIKFDAALSTYYAQYILRNYSSAGAIYRIIPSFLASLIIIIRQKKFRYYFEDSINIYLKIAYSTILITIMMILFPNITTFLDRFALYLTPLPLFVFTKSIKLRLYNVQKIDYNLLLLVSYTFYTFIWLEFAIHSKWFVPYKNVLFL